MNARHQTACLSNLTLTRPMPFRATSPIPGAPPSNLQSLPVDGKSPTSAEPKNEATKGERIASPARYRNDGEGRNRCSSGG